MPPPGHQHFGDRQIAVHGITRRMIDGADGWDLMLPRLAAFAGTCRWSPITSPPSGP
ncbi:hypothetical protein [Amycolatopsis plumensis]|uniref:hypothetical protein n=1 Tax=Amycolatopsis plumensis TaxID=236508 RepID=UPI00361172F6